MAQISYRANLSSAIYPLTLAQAGRSVIIPGPDNTYDRRVDPEGEQKNAGIPQAIYLENVIPTANGYQSVGSITKTPIVAASSATEFTALLHLSNPTATLSGGDNTGIRLAFTDAGTVYCNFSDLSSTWQLATSSGPDPWPPAAVSPTSKNDVSIATVRGTTYLVSNATWYEVEITAGTQVVNLLDVTASVTGLTAGHDLYICSSYNYLIVLDRTDNKIFWSSTTTPLDFTSSLVTGAGTASPNSLNTQGFFLTESPKGFFIYAKGGVVSAVYTGNSRYPWRFSPVANAGGYSVAENVASTASSEIQYTVDDSNKIFIISHDGAQLIAPEVTDWLSRIKTLDTYNQTTHTFSTTNLGVNVPLFTRIHEVMDRYVLVSFALSNPVDNEYSGCIVYDTLMKRYGKINISHSFIVSEDENLFFIQRKNPTADNQVRQVIFDIYAKDYLATADFSSVIVLGKFQYVRSRLITLDEIEIESVQAGDILTPQDFQVRVLPSIDGKNFDAAVTPVAVAGRSDGPLNTYNCRTTGRNVSLVFMGAFDLSSVQLVFHPDGGR